MFVLLIMSRFWGSRYMYQKVQEYMIVFFRLYFPISSRGVMFSLLIRRDGVDDMRINVSKEEVL